MIKSCEIDLFALDGRSSGEKRGWITAHQRRQHHRASTAGRQIRRRSGRPAVDRGREKESTLKTGYDDNRRAISQRRAPKPGVLRAEERHEGSAHCRAGQDHDAGACPQQNLTINILLEEALNNQHRHNEPIPLACHSGGIRHFGSQHSASTL